MPNRLVEPTGGKPRIDGRDMLAMGTTDLRALRNNKINAAFQRFAVPASHSPRERRPRHAGTRRRRGGAQPLKEIRRAQETFLSTTVTGKLVLTNPGRAEPMRIAEIHMYRHGLPVRYGPYWMGHAEAQALSTTLVKLVAGNGVVG